MIVLFILSLFDHTTCRLNGTTWGECSSNYINLSSSSTFLFFPSFRLKSWSYQSTTKEIDDYSHSMKMLLTCFVLFLIHIDDNRRTISIINRDRWVWQMRKRGQWVNKSHPYSCSTTNCNVGHKRVFLPMSFLLMKSSVSIDSFFLSYIDINCSHKYSISYLCVYMVDHPSVEYTQVNNRSVYWTSVDERLVFSKYNTFSAIWSNADDKHE
jgi:hypothetical protein